MLLSFLTAPLESLEKPDTQVNVEEACVAVNIRHSYHFNCINNLAKEARWPFDSGTSAPGSTPGLGHCVVFLGKTLYSRGASLHPGV